MLEVILYLVAAAILLGVPIYGFIRQTRRMDREFGYGHKDDAASPGRTDAR
jgi:hypothetical protein